ncbi:phasin family protein [Sphingomonas aquatilis]|uniref:phasin family protein n=1 Tax=Sphingomonas aquatilis TaxID=93063 RepID=UPI001FB8F9FF|nr:phasin family protein [Sphingomonas aquatilis]GKS03049.1 hypothetical protein Aug2020_07790 [Sphingomonas aquatilis]
MDDTAPKPPVKPAKVARRPERPVAAPPQSAVKPSLPKAKVAKKSVPAVPLATTPTAADIVPPLASIVPVSVVPDVAVEAAPVTREPAPELPVAPNAAALPPVVPTDPIAAATTAPIAPHAAKEVIMETIETVTAKTQTAFADATERAKGAVEKSQKMFEDANEFGKGNIEAMVESSKIAVRGLEALGQDAAAFAKKSFEEATAAAKTMTSVKSPTDFFKLQSDYARSAFDAMVQQTSRNTEAMLKLAGEVAQPLSNRVALAAEKMKVVA